jgi:pilus assembly protein Flp/PilA
VARALLSITAMRRRVVELSGGNPPFRNRRLAGVGDGLADPSHFTRGRNGQGEEMVKVWNAFWSDESGQGLTEYALIIGLVSVALVLLLIAMSDELGRVFNAIVDELEGVGPNQQTVT